MRKLIRLFRQACGRCHGMGVIEKANGDTMVCPRCKGKGIL